MDEKSLQQYGKDSERGEAAQALADNPLLVEALDSFVEKVTSAWTNSNPQDAAGREKLWHLLRAAQEFKAFIQATVDSGKIARMELENSRLSKLKRALRIA